MSMYKLNNNGWVWIFLCFLCLSITYLKYMKIPVALDHPLYPSEEAFFCSIETFLPFIFAILFMIFTVFSPSPMDISHLNFFEAS